MFQDYSISIQGQRNSGYLILITLGHSENITYSTCKE
uniref:Uncharacterized protein n=1 Tax=Rhizophora mucronata TaxID=61149 RepID=A0A2P2N8H7_RHIMU